MARGTSPRGQWLLLILALVAALGALAQTFRFDLQQSDLRASALSTDRALGSIAVMVADFRAAEAGYVATGQGSDFWIKRAGELAASIETAIGQLQSTSANQDAQTHYAAAMGVLGEMRTTDKRARDYVTNGQAFPASDVVFVDGLGVSRRLLNELDAAREAERAASEAELTRLARLRLAMNGAAFGVMFILALIVARRGVAPAAQSLQAGETPPTALAAGGLLLLGPASAAQPAPAPTEPAVRLPEVAQLCVDLARVVDGREMPALLERAANILKAKGLVLWAMDPGGTRLRPVFTHGYPEKIVERLGSLQIDADNVTSLAFRSNEAQVINGRSPDAFGAIAVPLVTASGCVGVLSAEVQRPRPDGDTLSAARMIAAQFAALTAPAGEAQGDRAAQA